MSQLNTRKRATLSTCRYAIGDLLGVVICVITASKGTTATSTLYKIPSLGMVVKVSTV